MTDAPVRTGPAAELARLMHERGFSTRIRALGPRLIVITISNPAVPKGQLSQCVAFTPSKKGGRFAWLFEGKGSGQFSTETIGPASEVTAAADRIARVLAITDLPDAS